MTTTTTAFEAKARCFEVLTAALAPTIQVDYGWPGDVKHLNEGVYLGDITWDETDWEGLGGNGDRTERYTIDLVVGAKIDGGAQQQATERAGEILGLCDVELTGNKTIVETPGWVIVKPRARTREGVTGNARATDVNAFIYIFAYLP